MMIDTTDENLANCFAAVEANNFEVQTLWKKHSTYWEEEHLGSLVNVGEFEGHKVWVSLRFIRIKGFLVVFYHATSTVVNWNTIMDYLEERLYSIDLKPVDAQNFHQVVYKVDIMGPRDTSEGENK